MVLNLKSSRQVVASSSCRLWSYTFPTFLKAASVLHGQTYQNLRCIGGLAIVGFLHQTLAYVNMCDLHLIFFSTFLISNLCGLQFHRWCGFVGVKYIRPVIRTTDIQLYKYQTIKEKIFHRFSERNIEPLKKCYTRTISILKSFLQFRSNVNIFAINAAIIAPRRSQLSVRTSVDSSCWHTRLVFSNSLL